MEFFNDYALLFAVSLPVVAIVGLQVYLFVAGESGTLLLPSLKPYPSIDLQKIGSVAAPKTIVVAESVGKPVEASNDAQERQAA
jgi:hypothetical protein